MRTEHRQQHEEQMATLADIVASDAQVKAELDTIAAGVTALQGSIKSLSDQVAALSANADPAALQAAADAAAALATEGQAIVDSLPKPAP
jgi:uncharacterized protein YoxC